MSCVHLGDKAGSLISQCCGGREKLVDLYHCNCPKKVELYAIPNQSIQGMAPVEVEGVRDTQVVTGCVGCPFFISETPIPAFNDPKPTTLAKSMWMEMRRRREGNQRKIDPLVECFATFQNHDRRPIHTRHLLYHIWPKRGGSWSQSLDSLEKRLPLFNGQKVVAIALDEDADDSVRQRLSWADKIIEVKNDPKLREVVSFHPLLESVEPYREGHATFCCHSKGVRHGSDGGTTVHAWSDVMYETLLDYWPYVHALLADHPIVGSLRKMGQFLAPSDAKWHYTGTYYWLRNEEVFQRDWRRVDRVWWGTESWPGLHFTEQEAGCAFLSGPALTMNLYDMRFMLDHVAPRLELFRSLMQDYRT